MEKDKTKPCSKCDDSSQVTTRSMAKKRKAKAASTNTQAPKCRHASGCFQQTENPGQIITRSMKGKQLLTKTRGDTVAKLDTKSEQAPGSSSQCSATSTARLLQTTHSSVQETTRSPGKRKLADDNSGQEPKAKRIDTRDRQGRKQLRTGRVQKRPKQDRTGRVQQRPKQDRTGRVQQRPTQDRTGRVQDRRGRVQQRPKQDRTGRVQDRSGRIQDRSGRIQDRSARVQDKSCQIRPNRSAENKQCYQLRKRTMTFATSDQLSRAVKFNKQTNDGPAFECLICDKTFFLKGVRNIESDELLSMLETAVEQSGRNFDMQHFLADVVIDENVFVCINCHDKLKKQQVPGTAVVNNMFLPKRPKELQLSELEETLIAKTLLFAKIMRLPTSRMPGIVDRIVNIPIQSKDIEDNVLTLPRDPEQANIVTVQLKRKKEYKSSVYDGYVRPDVLTKALKLLQTQGNHLYSDITVNEGYTLPVTECDKDANTETSDTLKNYDDFEKLLRDEADYRQNDPVAKFQSQDNGTSVLINMNPDVDLIVNTTKKNKLINNDNGVFVLAPGEGKVPTNFLRDREWDLKAFPTLHSEGKFGLDQHREISLSDQKYFVQRLLNKDQRWSKNTPFVFAALHHVELQQLEGAINVSFRKGKVQKETGGHAKVISVEEGHKVFSKIKGSAKYWQNAKAELMARVESLGPFTFFFTLSCPDKRWPEVFATMKSREGAEVEFQCGTEDYDSDKPSFEQGEILINGEPTDKAVQSESLHEMVKNDVLPVVRIFDNKLTNVIKHIIMGPGNPMNITKYTYRVEFQARGMPHAHGVLWSDTDDPGTKQALANISEGAFEIGDDSYEKAVNFIDKHISCDTSPTDTDLAEIVQFKYITILNPVAGRKVNAGSPFQGSLQTEP